MEMLNLALRVCKTLRITVGRRTGRCISRRPLAAAPRNAMKLLAIFILSLFSAATIAGTLVLEFDTGFGDPRRG